jgi:hypothetical protein
MAIYKITIRKGENNWSQYQLNSRLKVTPKNCRKIADEILHSSNEINEVEVSPL